MREHCAGAGAKPPQPLSMVYGLVWPGFVTSGVKGGREEGKKEERKEGRKEGRMLPKISNLSTVRLKSVNCLIIASHGIRNHNTNANLKLII